MGHPEFDSCNYTIRLTFNFSFKIHNIIVVIRLFVSGVVQSYWLTHSVTNNHVHHPFDSTMHELCNPYLDVLLVHGNNLLLFKNLRGRSSRYRAQQGRMPAQICKI